MRTMNDAHLTFPNMLWAIIAEYMGSLVRPYSANEIEAAVARDGNPAGG